MAAVQNILIISKHIVDQVLPKTFAVHRHKIILTTNDTVLFILLKLKYSIGLIKKRYYIVLGLFMSESCGMNSIWWTSENLNLISIKARKYFYFLRFQCSPMIVE